MQMMPEVSCSYLGFLGLSQQTSLLHLAQTKNDSIKSPITHSCRHIKAVHPQEQKVLPAQQSLSLLKPAAMHLGHQMHLLRHFQLKHLVWGPWKLSHPYHSHLTSLPTAPQVRMSAHRLAFTDPATSRISILEQYDMALTLQAFQQHLR